MTAAPAVALWPVDQPRLVAIVQWSLADLPPDEIVKIANRNVRTVKAWQRGEHLPDCESLARLVRGVPRLAAAWRWITALEAAADPDAEQEFNRFLLTLMRRP